MVFKQITTTLFAFTAMLIAGTSLVNAMDEEVKEAIEPGSWHFALSELCQHMNSEVSAARQLKADVECAEQEKSVEKMDEVILVMKRRTLFKNTENPYYSMNYLSELMEKRDEWAYEHAQKNLVAAEAEKSLPKLQAIIDSLGGASENIIPLEFYNSLLAKKEAWKKR